LEEENVEEVRLALDYLEQTTGRRTFVLIGLCSGARDALQAALRDPRIAGIAQIDGYAYPNFKYHLTRLRNHHLPRLLKLRAWRNLIGRIVADIRRRFGPDATASIRRSRFTLAYQPYPPRHEIEQAYAQLMQEQVALFVAYTGSWADQYNYREQFLDMYSSVDFSGRLTLEHWPEATHTLRYRRDQQLLLNALTRWLRSTEFRPRDPGAPHRS
jgi:hypothetical protein